MQVEIQLLLNKEKDTYSVLNLETGKYTSLQRNAALSLQSIFPRITRIFLNHTERTKYIKRGEY